jgi:YD repeat-containing protein
LTPDTSALVATSAYGYDGIGRLTGLLHQDGTSPTPVTLADYTWQYDAASRMTQMISPDGTVDFTHDDVNQLIEAESVQLPDENYLYDDNGNRTEVDGTEYDTTAGNRLASDGVFTYTYDPEGNRTARFVWTDGNQNGEVDPGEQSDVTEYTWDHRNRLTEVTDRATDGGPATQIVEYTYNSQNRRVCKAVDSDGNGFANLYHYDIYLGDRPWLEIFARTLPMRQRPVIRS